METLWKMGYSPYQLVQDFFHQQYDTKKTRVRVTQQLKKHVYNAKTALNCLYQGFRRWEKYNKTSNKSDRGF